MTVTGFFVCVIIVGAYLAVCYEDSDKRKFENVGTTFRRQVDSPTITVMDL